jgi:hypothetical protein
MFLMVATPGERQRERKAAGHFSHDSPSSYCTFGHLYENKKWKRKEEEEDQTENRKDKNNIHRYRRLLSSSFLLFFF